MKRMEAADLADVQFYVRMLLPELTQHIGQENSAQLQRQSQTDSAMAMRHFGYIIVKLLHLFQQMGDFFPEKMAVVGDDDFSPRPLEKI